MRGISNDDYQVSTKTTRDDAVDGIMETEGDFEEESLLEDIVCYNLFLIIGAL